MARAPNEAISLPMNYPATTIFVDESGSKSTASSFFVVAAVKLRKPGLLARQIKDVRDRYSFSQEFKFSQITKRAVPRYLEIIDLLEASDARLAACVVQGDVHNPFKGNTPAWRAHAAVLTQLLVGTINKREVVTVLMDGITTPRGCALDETVRTMTNTRLGSTSVVSAVCLDSRTNDLLQVVDLLASAVLFERRRAYGLGNREASPKGQVATYLGARFGMPGLTDGRAKRINIATYQGSRKRRPRSVQK